MAQWGRLVSCAREFSVLLHNQLMGTLKQDMISSWLLRDPYIWKSTRTIQNAAADTSVILRSAAIATDCNRLLKNQLLRAPFTELFHQTFITSYMRKFLLRGLAENNTSTFNYSPGTHSSSYLRRRMLIHRVQFTYPIP